MALALPWRAMHEAPDGTSPSSRHNAVSTEGERVREREREREIVSWRARTPCHS